MILSTTDYWILAAAAVIIVFNLLWFELHKIPTRQAISGVVIGVLLLGFALFDGMSAASAAQTVYVVPVG